MMGREQFLAFFISGGKIYFVKKRYTVNYLKICFISIINLQSCVEWHFMIYFVKYWFTLDFIKSTIAFLHETFFIQSHENSKGQYVNCTWNVIHIKPIIKRAQILRIMKRWAYCLRQQRHADGLKSRPGFTNFGPTGYLAYLKLWTVLRGIF